MNKFAFIVFLFIICTWRNLVLKLRFKTCYFQISIIILRKKAKTISSVASQNTINPIGGIRHIRQTIGLSNRVPSKISVSSLVTKVLIIITSNDISDQTIIVNNVSIVFFILKRRETLCFSPYWFYILAFYNFYVFKRYYWLDHFDHFRYISIFFELVDSSFCDRV